MDDELPILIYIVLHSQIPNILAELNFIKDFISLDQQLDDESMLITNISVSIEYIMKEWSADEVRFQNR